MKAASSFYVATGMGIWDNVYKKTGISPEPNNDGRCVQMKRVTSLLMVGMLLLLMGSTAFAARADYAGVWRFVGVEVQGIFVDAELLDVEMTFTLNVDGSCFLEINPHGSGEGTWTEVAGGIAIGDLSFLLQGDKLVAEVSPGLEKGKMILVRISAPVRIPGDVDTDGQADLEDAVALLRFAAGEGGTIDVSAADVNGDGHADIHDALRLFQYAAGWDVTLK